MNLYLYVNPHDFTNAQQQAFREKFVKVQFCETPDFTPILTDPKPKVLALDPDIIGWAFPNNIIAQISNLHTICLATTGYEWVDTAFCAEHHISVTNVPHYATNAVAEKCILMALALAKKLPLFLQAGKMNYDPPFIGEDLYNQPTDIIGFGAIGQALAQKLESLVGHKEICYYSRHPIDTDYHYCQFEDMLAKSEYMFITCTKNPESLALFDDLSRFNSRTKIIIVANGFEDVATRMARLVEAGKLGGVAFESDRPQPTYHGNVFVTPPNAYYTHGALRQLAQIWTNTILSTTDQTINQIN